MPCVDWIESLEQFAIDVILERRYGKRAALLRDLSLSGSRWFSALIVQTRLWLYRKRFLRNHPLGCMVISVGNLTVGGTGKTPIVERLARTLQENGRRVAILSRGIQKPSSTIAQTFIHGRLTGRINEAIPRVVSNGQNVLLGSRESGDEPFMLATNLPGVVVLVDKDRVKGGRYAVEHFGADTLILDDGLQYLHLQHRLDLVLIDRQAPFGNEYLLPRGTLREPPGNLRRASHIFITKSEAARITLPWSNASAATTARRKSSNAHTVRGICRKSSRASTSRSKCSRELTSRRSAPLPRRSRSRLPCEKLGAQVELSRRFTDHHRFNEQEIRAFAERCRRRDVAMILTTEKDAVRFPRRLDLPVPSTCCAWRSTFSAGNRAGRIASSASANRDP